MAPTTATAVRDELVALIVATVPTTLGVAPVDRFKEFKDDQKEWRKWAVDNVANCFRWLDARIDLATEPPPVTNGDIERWRYPIVFEVAYPRAQYRTIKSVKEMLQVADQDKKQIIQILRRPTDAHWIRDGYDETTEDVDGVRFSVFKAVYEFPLSML